MREWVREWTSERASDKVGYVGALGQSGAVPLVYDSEGGLGN